MVRAGSFLVLSLVLGISFVFVHSVSLADKNSTGQPIAKCTNNGK